MDSGFAIYIRAREELYRPPSSEQHAEHARERPLNVSGVRIWTLNPRARLSVNQRAFQPQSAGTTGYIRAIQARSYADALSLFSSLG